MPKTFDPIHPGEALVEDVVKPLGISINKLAKALAVDAARLNEIAHGRRAITPDTALRLSHFLGTSAEFWVGLQSNYDLRMARKQSLDRIQREVKPMRHAA